MDYLLVLPTMQTAEITAIEMILNVTELPKLPPKDVLMILFIQKKLILMRKMPQAIKTGPPQTHAAIVYANITMVLVVTTTVKQLPQFQPVISHNQPADHHVDVD